MGGSMHRLATLLALIATPASAASWDITALNGAPTEGAPVLTLEEDGALSGHTGCNRLSGHGQIEDGRLTLTLPLATTRVACPASLSQQEARLLDLLGSGARVESEGDGLRLTGAGVTALLIPQERAPDIRDAAYVIVSGVDATLNIRSEPSTASGVRARASLGRVMKNDGCEERPDRAWCRVRFIDNSGTDGWAAAEYLAAATAMRRAAAELFDEIGRLDCQISGGAVERCDFGVSREGRGGGTMLVYLPDDRHLLLSYDGKEFTLSDGVTDVPAQIAPINEGLSVVTDTATLSVPLSPFAGG